MKAWHQGVAGHKTQALLLLSAYAGSPGDLGLPLGSAAAVASSTSMSSASAPSSAPCCRLAPLLDLQPNNKEWSGNEHGGIATESPSCCTKDLAIWAPQIVASAFLFIRGCCARAHRLAACCCWWSAFKRLPPFPRLLLDPGALPAASRPEPAAAAVDCVNTHEPSWGLRVAA